MKTDLDALLTALYVHLDDHVLPSRRQRRRGRARLLGDAELVCVAVVQVLLGCDAEHRWLRLAPARIGHLFPRLPCQSEYNRHRGAGRGGASDRRSRRRPIGENDHQLWEVGAIHAVPLAGEFPVAEGRGAVSGLAAVEDDRAFDLAAVGDHLATGSANPTNLRPRRHQAGWR